jgi:hydroxymethylpyrimidine kinase/phosphomethylpyrimidine kinase
MSRPVALTIAGFDPTGGAGVLADALTFASFGLQPFGVVTSVTFQSATKFFGAEHQTAGAVRAQVEPLIDDATIACAKTGMLPTREVVLEVARLFRESNLPRPVVDPVMISSSGFRLMTEDAVEVLVSELLPLARVVTPNIPEAEALAGMPITSEADMRRAAAIIRSLGAGAVLIKGGHLGEQSPVDSRESTVGGKQKAERRRQKAESGLETGDSRLSTVPDVLDNQGSVTVFRERRLPGARLHGSGCVLSAAIAAGLGKGMTLEDSVENAKRFVFEKLKQITNAAAGR